MVKLISASQAAEMVENGACVAALGSGGGVLEPDFIYQALEQRFLREGAPRALTVIAACGFGDLDRGGINRFAHEEMTRRFIGGHWAWAPRMQALALQNQIEAYNLPQGALVCSYRELAAKRAGVITKTGLHTFVDPRFGGGKMNPRTKEDLVRLISLDGEDWLQYRLPPVDVAILRGSVADENGNICIREEAANGELLPMAQAAKNNGGIVICQVKRLTQAGTLSAREVAVPGFLVDAVVVCPEQRQTCESEYDPALTGQIRPPFRTFTPMPFSLRKIIARRAALELYPHAVINLGVGISDGVPSVAVEEGLSDDLVMTVEQGLIGGIPNRGVLFGTAAAPQMILDAPSQFDFYSGGGLDLAFLGMAQADQYGNVNVSKFGSRIAGCGGFIDISQSAKKCIFCGTFTADGLQANTHDGRLQILTEGHIRKFVSAVEQITYNARYSCSLGHSALYITERAVFRSTPDGLELIETAPGVSLEKDILHQMDFVPKISSHLKEMPSHIFEKQRCTERVKPFKN